MLEKELNDFMQVFVAIKFLKVGKIDTKSERFDAVLLIESTWNDVKLEKEFRYLVGNKIKRFDAIKNFVKAAEIYKFNSVSNWTPNLVVSNSIGELKEDISYKIEVITGNLKNETKINDQLNDIYENLSVRITETRKIKGTFYQPFDLREFPLDIQELSVSITTKNLFQNRIKFEENVSKKAADNRIDFIDIQQWKLLDYTKLAFRSENDTFYSVDQPFITATIYASRYATFYIFNVFIILLLISSMPFVTFSFSPSVPQFREIVCAILLMAPVNFRWSVTQLLPSVRYLTRLDEYGIGCLILSILVMCWNSLIGSSVITANKQSKAYYDTIVLVCLGICALIFNIFYILKLIYLYWIRAKIESKLSPNLIKYKNRRHLLTRKFEDLLDSSKINHTTRL